MKPKLAGLRNDIRTLFRYTKTIPLRALYAFLCHYDRTQINNALWHLSSKGELDVIKPGLYRVASLRWEESRQFSAVALERHWPSGKLPPHKPVAPRAQDPQQWRSRTVMAGRSFGQDDSPAR